MAKSSRIVVDWWIEMQATVITLDFRETPQSASDYGNVEEASWLKVNDRLRGTVLRKAKFPTSATTKMLDSMFPEYCSASEPVPSSFAPPADDKS